MMVFRLVLSLALIVSGARCQSGSSTLARLPGGQTAAAMLAASADGMSRYLAPDGPIQPGITAALGLPVRAGELANNGIARLSAGLDNGAQSLSRSAGQNGQIRMPGMEALESHMPASFASLGDSMHGMIKSKNNFIRSQAEKGIQAGNRLGDMMRQGLHGAMSVRSSGPMKLVSSAQDFMVKSSSTMQNQIKQHFEGALGRLSSVQGMGDGMRDQAHGIGRTLSSGVQGAVGQLQQTGEQVLGQLQGNHHKNTQAMSGILNSLQGSMGSMGGNIQSNIDQLMRHAQSTGQQLSSSLQQAAQAPLQMLSNLGGMMKSGAGQSSAGRY